MINHDPDQLHQQLMRQMKPQYSYPGGDVTAWQTKLGTKIRELLGLDQMPLAGNDLNIRTLWQRETDLGSIEKLIFSSEPGYDVPAYLCLPRDKSRMNKGKYPLFICLQGHGTSMHDSIGVDPDHDSRSLPVKDDGDYALHCMRRGIAALCLEQRAFGECEDKNRGDRPGCHNSAERALMLGRTLLGERVYDVSRALDLLGDRSDIDHSSLGIMGHSGGGSVALFAGALFDRITHVMSSCAFSSFKDSIMSLAHCSCNYVPHLLRYAEISDIAGLCAPGPLVIVNGRQDGIFPLNPALNSFSKVKKIYQQLGVPENCDQVIGEGGHRFFAREAWESMVKYL